ncbi:MAG: hypothetical protein ACI8RZ_008087 [Myxococcota bacterium]|jgi:hypothetical protein
MKPTSRVRLHVLMRPESPRAVVIWRGPGPKNLICTVHWDLDRDVFMIGHRYMNAQLNARESDISPDGSWMTYQVVNQKRDRFNKTYAAVSRAPFLAPVRLRYNSSGMLIWHVDRLSELTPGWPTDTIEGMNPQFRVVYKSFDTRLKRDGWALKETVTGPDYARVSRYRKWLHPFTLEKIVHGHRWYPTPDQGSRSGEAHRVLGAQGQVHEHNDWEWADLHNGRLLWAAGGVLYTCDRVHPDGDLLDIRVVHDLNDLRHLKNYEPPGARTAATQRSGSFRTDR